MIKYLVMDVDGTLTDGKIYISQFGEAVKAFNIKDGYGIRNILPQYKITPIVLTGRSSTVVEIRCKELEISNVFQGVNDKMSKLLEITDSLEYVAYIGDDNNDLLCMKEIKSAGGIVGCPQDSSNDVIEISDYVSEHKGGEGAVRDFIEWICRID